jgi:hypothetical protein
MPLNRITGTTVPDLSQHNNYGVVPSSGISIVSGIGDGGNGLYFNNTATYIDNAYPQWDGDLFTAIVWGKIDDATLWNNSQGTHRWIFHPRSSTDVTYYSSMGRNQATNQLEWRRRAGTFIVSEVFEYSSAYLDWFCMGITASFSGNFVRFYLYDALNGFQRVGEETGGGIESWTNTEIPDGSDTVLYAGNDAGAQTWIGHGAHCYTWAGVALTDSQMQQIMVA